jgi:hypothetical protein
MGHCLSLFIGHKTALRVIVEIVPAAQVFALTPDATVFVLPLTDAVHAGLHAANGTGEWLDLASDESGFLFTTTDMVVAARASVGSALAWVATEYHGGDGEQIAAVWIDGQLQMKPTLLREGETRPPALRPINMALRQLGVATKAPRDAFDTFGLGAYRWNDDIVAEATPVRL